MGGMNKEPVFLEAPLRRERTWVYPWLGLLVGLGLGILVGHPLAMVVQNIHAHISEGASLDIGGALIHSFHVHMWPMTLLFALFGGIVWAVIGWIFKHLRENRLRLDTLHQEFELQVATLRHQYKNLAIGIQGFSHRVKNKLKELDHALKSCEMPDCPAFTHSRQGMEALEQNVNILEEAAQRLTHTLGQELLFLKALTSDTLAPAPQDFYHVLIHCIKELRRLRFREKEIRVTLNGQSLEESCPVGLVFPFEPYTTEVILQNILTNAMKFGDIIRIRVAEAHDRVRVEIQDNGPGVEVEKLQRHLLTPADRKEESTHLGLKVSLHLLAKCGGRLGVLSEPGAGATFILDFPK
jgi:signal transduction histidine kinase